MMMLSNSQSGMSGMVPMSPFAPPKTALDSSGIMPPGEKLLPSIIQQLAKASTSLPGNTWPVVPSCTSAFSPANHEQPTTTVPAVGATNKQSLGFPKMDPSTLATQVLEQHLASHLLERYSQQLSSAGPQFRGSSAAPNPPQLFSSAPGAGLLSASHFTTSNAFINNQISTTNALLGSHLSAPHLFGGHHGLGGQHGLGAHANSSLILPRFNTTLSPGISPRVGLKDYMKGEENNSRRLRWKEEHGRVLISIWKEKYPQVRAAKKIKEKHAIWQEIGDEYNKYCVKYDWPARSTDQVKIKVKNCIDEYKQTIKYNQEYKTCPYFQDIDDIFGMSDPEKAAELQRAIVSPGNHSDNAYWSGTSLPTQVKKRKLNITCGLESGPVVKETSEPSSKSPRSSPVRLPSSSPTTPSTDCSRRLETPDKPKPLVFETRLGSAAIKTEEARYDLKIPGAPRQPDLPGAPRQPDQSTISMMSEFIKQLHDREDRIIETFHKMEQERHEAEYQLEKIRQSFLSNVIEKLLDVIKDKGLIGPVETAQLFPTLIEPSNTLTADR